MPYCVSLARIQMSRDGAITLVAGDGQTARTMATIISRAFSRSKFERRWVRLANDRLQLFESLRMRSADVEVAALKSLGGLLVEHITIEDDLDECHALDFHMTKVGDDRFVRTEWGDLEYRAKSRRHRASRIAIGEKMVEFIQRHPRYARAAYVCPLPSHGRGTANTLPQRLCAQIAESVSMRLVPMERTRVCAQQKEIDSEEKEVAAAQRRLNQAKSMSANALAKRGAVILIDDMYGSGASMTEAARALRSAGASDILGLTVTKQLRFSKYR